MRGVRERLPAEAQRPVIFFILFFQASKQGGSSLLHGRRAA
jgi:hypothetical protein